MAQTERKQVGRVGDLLSALISQDNSPTLPISGAVHGLTKDLTYTGLGFGYAAPAFSMVFPATNALVDADFVNNQYWYNGAPTTLATLFTQQIVTATPTFVLKADGTYALNSGGIQSLRRSDLGLQIDDDRTDSTRFARDMTQANWTALNIGVLRNAIGITGAVNTANTLTCNLAGGTVLQTLAASSRPWRMRPHIKRVSGAGVVEISLDNITWYDITAQLINGTFVRIVVPDQTLANPTFGIRMQGLTDVVVVDCFNNCGDNVVTEWGPCAATAGASLKTWRDRPASYNTDNSPVATYMKTSVLRCVYMELAFRQAGALFATDGDFGASIGLANASVGAIVTANPGLVSGYALNVVNKVLVSKDAGETSIVLNGGALAKGAGGAPDAAHTHTDWMTNGLGNLSNMGAFRRLVLFSIAPTDLQKIAATV